MALTALILMAFAVTAFALGNRRAAHATGQDPNVFGRGDGALPFLGRVHRAVFAMAFGGLVLGASWAEAGPGGLILASEHTNLHFKEWLYMSPLFTTLCGTRTEEPRSAMP